MPSPQHLLFQRDTVDRKLFHRCLPNSRLSDHLLHFGALALKQQLNPARKESTIRAGKETGVLHPPKELVQPKLLLQALWMSWGKRQLPHHK